MRKLYVPRNEGDAALILSLLNAAGIPTFYQDNKGVYNTDASSIWVLKDSDVDKASKIVEEYGHVKDVATPNDGQWTCWKCSEYHAQTFTTCWKCGSPRP